MAAVQCYSHSKCAHHPGIPRLPPAALAHYSINFLLPSRINAHQSQVHLLLCDQ